MNKVLAILLATAMPVAAQWLNYPDSRTPHTRDGKPNLSAPTPRVQGKPDLSGVWQAERTSEQEFVRALGKEFAQLQIDPQDFTKNVFNVFWGLPPEAEPLKPAGIAAYKRHQENPTQYPHTQCLPDGLPADMLVLAFKLLQMPQETVILTEIGSPPRQIYTDGRPLPKNLDPTWMGYSIGKWEGDTFVVHTTGLNERGWLDALGHPRSEQMQINERYLRRDFGHMDLEFTFDDPTYYTRPFSVNVKLNLLADSDLLEYVCENEHDRAHLGR
jgi:hypothetical protein